MEQNEENLKDGVFRGLLRFRVESGDHVLEAHLKNTSSRATYVSKSTQNELLACCKEEVQEELIRRVSKASVWSLLFDETTDVSGVEQLSLSFRYLHENTIHEHFF